MDREPDAAVDEDREGRVLAYLQTKDWFVKQSPEAQRKLVELYAGGY